MHLHFFLVYVAWKYQTCISILSLLTSRIMKVNLYIGNTRAKQIPLPFLGLTLSPNISRYKVLKRIFSWIKNERLYLLLLKCSRNSTDVNSLMILGIIYHGCMIVKSSVQIFILRWHKAFGNIYEIFSGLWDLTINSLLKATNKYSVHIIVVFNIWTRYFWSFFNMDIRLIFRWISWNQNSTRIISFCQMIYKY